jgi:transposase
MATKMDEVTKRRVRAGRMLQRGLTPAEVAARVGVARQTVYTWKQTLDEGGIDALRERRRTGPQSKLDEAALSCLREILLESPTAHGFGTELWTLKRVQQVIQRLFGVRYSEVHIWRLLGQMGFSSQKPERRAVERDQDAIRTWKRRTWPVLKKKPSAKGV